jgi:hypothetical protein
MGRGEYSHDDYTSGSKGYDVWIRALEHTDDPAGEGHHFGHAFNVACWYECRRHAVAFLEEARERLNDESVSPLFDGAVAHYRTVAEEFKKLTELYPCEPWDDAAMRERFGDAALRRKAVAALAAARAAEAEGLEALARIEEALAR